MPNHLAGETSPYLLQHKDNPVDWYPWGEDAFTKARTEDKPVLLSVGYSSCHWCHVMAHESFEDEETAGVMNALYVSVKVDREERPDIDTIYMQAVQSLTGSGGWPMTVFMTPEGRPFYGGTYFPPDDRYGVPAFKSILLAAADAYHNRPDEIKQSADEIVKRVKAATTVASPAEVGIDTLTDALQKAKRMFAPVEGGFGKAPKFPQPMALEFLLRCAHRFNDAEALQMAEFTLEKMARGGIYDQIGGGFHRYSTDVQWLVPHFEKMLYDNALLSRVYLHAFQLTGKPFYKDIAVEVLDYVAREMTSPEGGFYSTQDADSERHEGKFFVWTPEELLQALGKRDAKVVSAYYGVTPHGNFEGKSILHATSSPEEVSQALGISSQVVRTILKAARAKLYGMREQRVHPGRDDKVLTAWNGMMLRSFAEAGGVLGRDDYVTVASRSAEFILGRLRERGRLLRSYRAGQAKVSAYLEDYALMADGLLSLYEATFHRRWLDESMALARTMNALFWDSGDKAFYDTAKDQEALVVRPRDIFDNATPSGNSVAVDVLLRLAAMTGDFDLHATAMANVRGVAALMSQYPLGFGHWLCALDFALSTPKEIVIVGTRDDNATRDLLNVVYGGFLPNKVVAGFDPTLGREAARGLPLLQDRALVDGLPTAYVCENFTCRLPVTTPEALASQMGGLGT